jgi:hypothetical protein
MAPSRVRARRSDGAKSGAYPGIGVAGPPLKVHCMDETFPWDPLDYPFELASSSFVWSAADVVPLSSTVDVEDLWAGRRPVAAIGSNASPGQLSRKFGGVRFADPASPDGQVPVLRAELDDVDVVYGAHLASYGSLPATLLDAPGATAQVFITWLTPAQLDRMNETEGLGYAYQLRGLEGARCHDREVGPVMSYVTVDGACLLGGSPLGLSAFACPGSSRPRGTERQAWDQLATDMGCDVGAQGLMDRVLGSAPWRERVESHLASHRLPETQAPCAL